MVEMPDLGFYKKLNQETQFLVPSITFLTHT